MEMQGGQMLIPKNTLEQNAWCNAQNANYFDGWTREIFDVYLNRTGLQYLDDIKIITPLIKNAKTVLDVSSGYGRVIDALLERKIGNKITALEWSPNIADYLERKFHAKIGVYNIDLLKFYTDLSYDVILWMWSGITDFSPVEQRYLVSKLSALLNKNGKLIIDTPQPSVLPVNVILKNKKNGGYYTDVLKDNQLQGYIPRGIEMLSYAKIAKMDVQCIPYITKKGVYRVLYILTNPNATFEKCRSIGEVTF